MANNDLVPLDLRRHLYTVHHDIGSAFVVSKRDQTNIIRTRIRRRGAHAHDALWDDLVDQSDTGSA
eukprot:8337455-Pyramimonas_sp.AAC.1